MSNSSGNASSGIGFFGLLFIVFLVLKLGVGSTIVQTWSWWWVCAPLWGPTALILVILLLCGIIYAIVKLVPPVVKLVKKVVNLVVKLCSKF